MTNEDVEHIRVMARGVCESSTGGCLCAERGRACHAVSIWGDVVRNALSALKKAGYSVVNQEEEEL